MRIVKEIPHHTFKITVFTTNAKYLIKLEWGGFEQTYKIAENDLSGGLTDIENMLDDDFLKSCMLRFNSMYEDFKKQFNKLNHA